MHQGFEGLGAKIVRVLSFMILRDNTLILHSGMSKHGNSNKFVTVAVFLRILIIFKAIPLPYKDS